MAKKIVMCVIASKSWLKNTLALRTNFIHVSYIKRIMKMLREKSANVVSQKITKKLKKIVNSDEDIKSVVIHFPPFLLMVFINQKSTQCFLASTAMQFFPAFFIKSTHTHTPKIHIQWHRVDNFSRSFLCMSEMKNYCWVLLHAKSINVEHFHNTIIDGVDTYKMWKWWRNYLKHNPSGS